MEANQQDTHYSPAKYGQKAESTALAPHGAGDEAPFSRRELANKRNAWFALGLVVAVLVGCESKRRASGGATGGDGMNGEDQQTTDASDETTDVVYDCNDAPLQRKRLLRPDGEDHPDARDAMTVMTLEEKIAILSGGEICPDYSCDFDGTGVPSLGIRDFRMRDGPRGVHTHDGTQATTFAVAMARAATFDLDLEERVGQVQGKEMVALHYDLALAPTINTLRHPGWARAQETYGEDPVVLGKMGAAYTNGVQEFVPACPKHFAANNTDENRGFMIANMDEQTLRENYTLAFKIVVEKSDPACIMAAYNGVNGFTATENHHLLTEILRDDWNWEGFVVSDWWATTPDSGAETIKAGMDLEMPDERAFQTLSSSESAEIERSAMRVLNARARWGQLESDYRSGTPDPGIVETPEHKQLARETAEKGSVLLVNDGILPIADDVTSIAVMGPDANLPVPTTDSNQVVHGLGDRGSSNTNPPYAVSYYDGIADRAGENVEVTTSTAPEDAAGKDIVIIPVTMQHEDEGEAFGGGGDRDDLTLSFNHPQHWGSTKPTAFINQVAEVNPNVVVLLAVGSAIVMEDWGASARGVVQTFYPGQEAGNAVASLLFGDVNFSGRLPFTVARNPDQYPYFGNQDAEVDFEYLHGYRKFEKEGLSPRFWFGFGLSYTTYEYGDIAIECEGATVPPDGAINATVPVTNTGDVPGDEVVQAYIGYPNTAARRPVKELKAFKRTGVIEPGETVEVSFSIPVREMAYWGSDGWVVENVAHDLIISSSANPQDPNMRSASFEVQ